MRIQDVCKRTKLTKKAVAYYMKQSLINPAVSKNGYRDFGEDDVARLRKIAVLRKLGLRTDDIKAALADKTGLVLSSIALKNELAARRQHAKGALLRSLCQGASYESVYAALEGLEQSASITERLSQIFPGYYGSFCCLHFARFLQEPVSTDEQRRAYAEISSFLDNMPPPRLSEALRGYAEEATALFDIGTIEQVLEAKSRYLEVPAAFMRVNKSAANVIAYLREADRQSPPMMLYAAMKEYCAASGFYDVFIPALQRFSPSYAAYAAQMDAVSLKLRGRFPALRPGAVPESRES